MAVAAMTPRSLESAFMRFILPADSFTGAIMARARQPHRLVVARHLRIAGAARGSAAGDGACPVAEPQRLALLSYEDTPAMIVAANTVRFDSIALDNGTTLGPVEVAYETYGELNTAKNNAIVG